MLIISWHSPTDRWYWFAVAEDGAVGTGSSGFSYAEAAEQAKEWLAAANTGTHHPMMGAL